MARVRWVRQRLSHREARTLRPISPLQATAHLADASNWLRLYVASRAAPSSRTRYPFRNGSTRWSASSFIKKWQSVTMGKV
jgi:hypothetical protein